MIDKTKFVITPYGDLREIDEYIQDMETYKNLTDEELWKMYEEEWKKRQDFEVIQGESDSSWYVK